MRSLPIQFFALVFALALFPLAALAVEAPDASSVELGFEAAAGRPFVGIPTDWSDRHVIFSTPSDDSTRARVERNPRYWLDLMRRQRSAAPVARQPLDLQAAVFSSVSKPSTAKSRPGRLKRDWSEALGSSTNSQVRRTFPAKYSFNSTAGKCSGNGGDYVVYTLANTSANQFNLIAYENLYVNDDGMGYCPGTAPTPKFVYNASQNPAQPLNGEPVISLDGTKIAFVENQNQGAAQALFHVLLWREGDVPTAASRPFPAPYNSVAGVTTALADCAVNGAVAPCEYTVTYSSLNSATASSPYVDYGSDTAYVTDDGGHVLAIAPVFNATPANPPAIVTGWGTAAAPAVTTTGGHQLTPTVFDPVSGNLFVADLTGGLFYVRTNSSSPGSCLAGSAPCLGAASLIIGSLTGAVTAAIADPPLIDIDREAVYAFSQGHPPGLALGSFLTQSNTTLSTSVTAILGSGIGLGGAVVPAGAFDSAFINSTDGTGLIYGCGFNIDDFPRLIAFPISAGTLSTASVGAFSLATAPAACSPPTETLRDGIKDMLFIGVQNNCPKDDSSSGCLFSYNITNGFPQTSTPMSEIPEAGGTTGITIDNTTDIYRQTETNLYFSTTASRTCNDYFGNAQTTGQCAVSLNQKFHQD
ncbi:MAG TPA: hypothetical protein VKS22_12070 [Candidatus Binataceae bacterium]|nr:hypothetical protein [Candidatus Binataceae bacterium]